MLEILFVSWLVRKLGGLAQAKGRSKGWGGLGVLFWFAGEVMGFLVGGMMEFGMGAYLVALVVAGIGAGVSYAIVNGLAPAEQAIQPVP